MNKHWFYIFVVIVITIFFSGCSEMFVEEACKDPDSLELKIICLFEGKSGGGSSKQDPCAGVEGEEMDRCMRDNAVDNADSSACGKISSQALRDDCYYQISLSEKNARLCDEINNQILRDNCRLSIGKDTGYTGICDDIQNQNQRNSCYREVAMATGNISLCDQLPDSEIVECVISIAVDKGDATLCDKLYYLEKAVIDACVMKVVGESEEIDLRYCEMLEDKSLMINCYNVIASSRKDASYCEKAGLDRADTESCIFSVINRLEDASACGNVQDEKLKDFCFDKAAEVCDSITYPEASDDCWAKFFIAIG